MHRNLKMLALGLCANALVAAPALAQSAEVTLTRLADCGTQQAPTEVNQRFSDTFAFGDLKTDRKSTRLNSSHVKRSRMPSSA